eukprot:scaffold6781_cov204-Amphora_coffeaeformis.AAC.37
MIKARLQWCLLLLLQLTATSLVGASSSIDAGAGQEKEEFRRLGFAEWKSRIFGGNKEGAGTVIPNPNKDEKEDSPPATDTTATAITVVKMSRPSASVASGTASVTTVKRSQNRWYMRPGTTKKIPSYTKKSMKSMKSTRNRAKPKVYVDTLRNRPRSFPKYVPPKDSSNNKSKMKSSKVNTKRTRPHSKYVPSMNDTTKKSYMKSPKVNTKRTRPRSKYYSYKTDTTKKSKVKSSKVYYKRTRPFPKYSTKKSKKKSSKMYSKKKSRGYHKKIIPSPGIPLPPYRPPKRPTRPTVRPPYRPQTPTPKPSLATPTSSPTVGPQTISVQLPVGVPGAPAVLFDLVQDGSDATLELDFSNGVYDTVYLVENADVAFDCPTAEGTLIAVSPIASLTIPLNRVDSVIVLCDGEDVVTKAYYVFEGFKNGVGGSNLRDEYPDNFIDIIPISAGGFVGTYPFGPAVFREGAGTIIFNTAPLASNITFFRAPIEVAAKLGALCPQETERLPPDETVS